MTEEEKIFAGKMFDPRKQELKDIKHKAHIACQKFNAMDEYDPQRSRVIGEILGKTGKVYYFQGPVQFNYGCHTFIGENFFANFNLTVMDDGPIYIGDNVCFGPNVSLMATNHPLIANVIKLRNIEKSQIEKYGIFLLKSVDNSHDLCGRFYQILRSGR
mgnify:CR=1 FL=1